MIEEREKHPEFDEYWEKHKNFVFWTANKIARKMEADREGLTGTLTLWFNHLLYSYDETKGKFTTYFFRHSLAVIIREWLRYESESWSVFYHNQNRDEDDVILTDKNFAEHEANYKLYRVPEEDMSDIMEVVHFFETVEECWEFMTRSLERRDREILLLYFREDLTLLQIGKKFGVSRERIRQILERAKGKVRERLKMVSAFTNLFERQEWEQQRETT